MSIHERQDATKAFFDALEELPKTLAVDEEPLSKSRAKPEHNGSNSAYHPEKAFDLHDLEAAAADIEQYIESLHPHSPE